LIAKAATFIALAFYSVVSASLFLQLPRVDISRFAVFLSGSYPVAILPDALLCGLGLLQHPNMEILKLGPGGL